MSTIKNYGLVGVGSTIQLGKRGGSLRYATNVADGSGGNAPAFQLRSFDDSGLMRLQVAAPRHIDDAVNKTYVDNLVQGLNIKASVRLASNAQNIPLTGNHPVSIDGVNAADGDRVLLKDQTNAKENGIYVYTVAGANYTLTRAPDANNQGVDGSSTAEVTGGMFTFIEDGVINGDTGWVMSLPNGKANLGVDSLAFVQFSSAGTVQGGAAIVRTGNAMDVQVDNTTMMINGSNKLAVKSSGTSGQLLISQGSGAAVWGSLNLGNSNTVGTSVLAPANGGTGISTYTVGDILVADGAASLKKLTKGSNNTLLGIDASGNVAYRFISTLRDNTGNPILTGSGAANPTNYATLINSADAGDIVFGTAGTGAASINLQLAPRGNGLVIAKAGYDAFLQTNRAIISDETFVTKGFVDFRVGSVDTTKIQNPGGDTFFATNQNGYTNKAIVSSNNKVVAQFIGSTATGVATNGEYFRVSHITDEVQIGAANSSGAGNVNLRLLPQAQGQVFIGATGAGLIQGEDGYILTLKGGNGVGTNPAGNLILRGGDSSSGNLDAGAVRIFPGTASGTGKRGTVSVEDDRQVKIVEFKSPANPAGNWMEIENSVSDVDPVVSSLKIRAAAGSASGDVGILLDPKGNGLVRVGDSATYDEQLATTGQLDALTTKGYVNSLLSATSRDPGTGLSDDGSSLNINVGSVSIKTDSANNLIVNSSNVQGQVMLSSGTAGVEAGWGALNLANSNAITGTLPVGNGGTGLTSYSQNDLLVGNAGGSLSKLTKGSNNAVLQVNNSGNIAWGFITTVRDANGASALQATGVASAVNYATVKNAAVGGFVELGADGADTNVSMVLKPKGNGLVFAVDGYTANIGTNRETLVTKGYVDDSLSFNADPLLRRRVITTGWASTMDIGVALPSVGSRQVYVHRCTINVVTPLAGDSVYQARVMAGLNQVMSFDENDIGASGTYVVDLPFAFTSANTKVTIEFFKADGTTPATPISGNLTVTAEYKIV